MRNEIEMKRKKKSTVTKRNLPKRNQLETIPEQNEATETK